MQNPPSKVSLAWYPPPRFPRRGPCSRPKPFPVEQPLAPFPRSFRPAVTAPFSPGKNALHGGVPRRNQPQRGLLHIRHCGHLRDNGGGRQPYLFHGHPQSAVATPGANTPTVVFPAITTVARRFLPAVVLLQLFLRCRPQDGIVGLVVSRSKSLDEGKRWGGLLFAPDRWGYLSHTRTYLLSARPTHSATPY